MTQLDEYSSQEASQKASDNAHTSTSSPHIPQTSPENYIQAIKDAIKLAVPHTAASFVMMGGNFVGVTFIAKLGPKALAASNVAFSIQNWFTSTIGASISTATDLAAKELGKENKLGVGSVLQKSWLLSLISSAPAVGIMLASKPILTLLHQDETVTELVKQYFDGFIWGLPAMFLLTSNRQIALAAGNPGIALAFVTAYQAADTALSYGLIYGKGFLPELGISGLGYSNSITAWLTFLSFTGYMALSNQFKDYKILRLRQFNKQSRSELWKVTRAALWSGIKVGAELASMLSANLMIGVMGANQQAAQEASFQYIFLINPIMFGITDTAGKLISKEVGSSEVGRSNINKAKRYGYASLGLGAASAAVFLIFFITMPHILLKAFDIDNTANSDILGLASMLLLVNGLTQIADSIRNIALRALNGFEDRIIPTVIIILTLLVIFAPLSYAMGFPLDMQATGVMIARGISIAAGAAILLTRWTLTDKIKEPASKNAPPAINYEGTETTPLLPQTEKNRWSTYANYFQRNSSDKKSQNQKEAMLEKQSSPARNRKCAMM